MSNQTRQFGSDEHAFMDFGEQAATGAGRGPRTELEATFVRVQRALRQPGDLPTLPLDLKSQIWEDIMASATPTPDAHAIPNPWPAPARARAAAKRHPAPPFRRMAWSHAANIALAALVILAGLGVWRVFGGDFGSGGGGTDDPTMIPGVAMQPSTPETIEAPAVVPSPVATPAPITACDLSGDIPIIPDLAEDQSPVTTTSLYVVRDDPGFNYRGDLKLGCEDEDSVTLAENVISVWPGPWPGTVSVAILPPGEEDLTKQLNGYVNILSGEMVTFDKPADDTAAQSVMTYSTDGSPWVIGPLVDDPSQLAVVDLRTMDARPFSDVAGVPTPGGATLLLSSPSDDGTVAVGLAHSYADGGAHGGTLESSESAPGDLILLGAPFDDARWITVPDELPRISAVTLSPDGSHAAVVSMGEGDVVADSYVYGVISTVDGSVVGRSADIERQDNPFVTWIQDGKAAVYTAGNEVQTIAIDGTGEPKTVYTADQQMMQLQTTWDPNVIVATTRRDHGSDGPQKPTDRDMVYSVDVATGGVHEFTGMDASASIGWITDAGALVMYQWDDAYRDTLTYQVFDPVTGKQIGEIADAPSVQPRARTLPTIGTSSITVSEDGRVEVIGIGTQHIYAFTVGADGMTMRRVASPDGLLAEMFLTASLTVSPDCTMLSLTGAEDEGRTRHLIALNDPDAEWLVVPNNVVGERGRGMIGFAEGID
jgi:hypothetical protein